jgi:hypothetical protein
MTDFSTTTSPSAASPASFGAFQPQSPFESTATESFLQRFDNALDPAQLTGPEPLPSIVPSLPENLSSIQGKYAELAPLINELPERIRNSLLDFDSKRVARGSKPLTRDETLTIIETVMAQTPATPPPERSLWNVPGNVLSDLGSIVKSIPQIPMALVNEFTSLGQMGEGSNAISQLANAPGVRMLPGSFIVGNLAEGDVANLAKHPLFTALDALPFASQVAKGTRVGQVATETAEAAGKTPRPLAAALTQTLDENGNLIDRTPRMMVKRLRDETGLGVKLDNVFGSRSRNTMREFEMARMKVIAEAQGLEPNADVVAEATRRAVALNEKFGFSETQIADLYRKFGEGVPASQLTAQELAYRSEYRDILRTFGEENVRRGDMAMIGDELYPMAQAEEIITVEREASHTRAMAALRREWQGAGKRFTPTDLGEFLDDALNRRDPAGPAKTAWQVKELHALINVMDAYGYQMADVRKLLRSANRSNSKFSLVDVADAIRSEFGSTDWDSLTRRPTANQVAMALRKMNDNDPQAIRLQMAVTSGNGPEISRALKNILNRKNRKELFTPEFVEAVRNLRDQQHVDMTLRNYTQRRADLSAQKLNTLMDKTAPARFGPLIGKYTREGVEVATRDAVRPGTYGTKKILGANAEFVRMEEMALGRTLTADEVADVVRRIKEEDWGSFSFGDQVGRTADMGGMGGMVDEVVDVAAANRRAIANFYQGIEAEVAKTWRYLKERGEDPTFVHTATRARVHATLRPAPGPLPVNLSQVQERAVDLTPGIQNPGVALSHQGMELLMRRSSEDALDHVLQQYGVPEFELRQRYGVAARESANLDPFWGFKGELKDIVQKRYMPVDLNNLGFDWRSARLSKYNQETFFVPRAVYETLSQITNRPKSAFGNIIDPVTRVFRASVIGLSPRTQLYNILGGATMLMGETGPGGFKYLKQAYEWSKNPELIPTDQVALRRVIGAQREIMRDFDEGLSAVERQKKAMWNAQFAGGRQLGNWWKQIQESRATKGLGKATDFMYDLNARMDDMYRTMAYLYGYDKQLTKDMSREVAERAGMEMLQKVMMDWAGMTPVERTILKGVLPFYSFINHAVRYVFRYPIDHPLRAGVLGAFGRAQQDDLDAMLPDRFLGAFFFGAMDDNGKQNALNLTPFNPFGDVANMVTFSGFLSALNPVFATVLDSVGIDRGEAELYPSLRFNPETGRLEGVRTNPLLAFAGNVIPQTEVLATVLGAHTNLSEQIRRDPAGAWRSIASAGGFPILWRNYNVPQEQFKTELARHDSQSNALNAALKSGNWSEAGRYPGLAGIRENVASLPPEVLATFTPPEAQAIRAQLEALLAGQQGQWSPPDGYSELLDAAITPTPSPIAQSFSIGGI